MIAEAGSFQGSDFDRFSRAMLNILEDFAAEKARIQDTQRAILNILEDSAGEKSVLEATQKASLNILTDFGEEKARLADVQKAMINILEDMEGEKKKVEQAKAAADAANRELESFSYSVAHDLKAPLRGIDGFSQALVEDCADRLGDDGRDYLRRIRDSAQQMARLIDDLLALAHISQAELNRERVDLAAIARTVLARLREEQPQREVEPVLPAELVAFGDSRLLGVVLENLLNNAWKFSRKRAPAKIELGRRSEVYFVRDNGAGFDMAFADKLFGVFQRLHAESEFEGTGIGLVTVQRIVRRHRGRIWAESEPDRGATFYFTLGEGS